jgi:hypothetical protein
MSRTPANEAMVRKSIYGPARLLERENLSEYVVSLMEANTTTGKLIDPAQATVQSKIFEYIQEDPALPGKYSRDEFVVERMLMARLLSNQIAATESQISAALTAYEKVRS